MADPGSLEQVNGQQDFWPAEAGYDYGNVLPLRRSQAPGSPLQLAIPNFVRSAVNDLALSATAPANALAGRLPSEQLPAIASRMGMTLLGLGTGTNALMGGGEASLGMFAGRGASGADTGALARAMHLDSKGFAPEDIHADTGWFKGPDEQWRFEIPDAGAKWIGPTMSRVGINGDNVIRTTLPPNEDIRLADIIHHPQLFSQYPELASIPIRNVPLGAALRGAAGAYDPKNNLIYLSTSKPAEAVSTVLHETQHAIQTREGFALGGNSNEFLPPEFHKTYDAETRKLSGIEDQIRASGANPFTVYGAVRQIQSGFEPRPDQTVELAKVINHDPSLINDYSDQLKVLEPLKAQKAEAFAKYQSLAGEVEARNVQERHAQGAYGTFPLATQGYPPGPQIVRFRNQPARLEPVEHDPWAAQLTPVDHDPFEEKYEKGETQ